MHIYLLLYQVLHPVIGTTSITNLQAGMQVAASATLFPHTNHSVTLTYKQSSGEMLRYVDKDGEEDDVMQLFARNR